MAKERIQSPEMKDGEKFKGPPKSRCFVCVIQADEPRQVAVLSHLTRYNQLYRAVYILHDKDKVSPSDVEDKPDKYTSADVGKFKPPHYHVNFRTQNPCYAKALTDRFGGAVNVLSCSDETGNLLYMVHDTPQCDLDREYKFLYDLSELKGDQNRIAMLLKQNGHFVQLQHLMDYLDQGLTIRSTVSALSVSNDSAVIDALMGDNAVRSIWLQAQRQEENILRLKQVMAEVKSEIKEEM